MSVLEHVKTCLLVDPFRAESSQIICKKFQSNFPRLFFQLLRCLILILLINFQLLFLTGCWTMMKMFVNKLSLWSVMWFAMPSRQYQLKLLSWSPNAFETNLYVCMFYHFNRSFLPYLLQYCDDFCCFQLIVKRYTMERLADIYRASCINQSSSSVENDEFDWIVGKILRCFYDKDFR